MKKIKIGCIGMGQRGVVMTKTILAMFDNVEIVAVCDLYEDRAKAGAVLIKESKGYEPIATTCADDIMKMDEHYSTFRGINQQGRRTCSNSGLYGWKMGSL